MKIFSVLLISCSLFFSLVYARAEITQNIHIEITSYLGDQQVFQQGDELRFLLSLDRKAYLYVFYQTVDKKLIQLIPNKHKKNNFFNADIFIEVPDEASPYQFIVSPPLGKERVYGVAVDRFMQFEGTNLANGLKRLDISIDEVKKRVVDTAIQYYGWSDFSLLTSERRIPTSRMSAFFSSHL